MWRKKIYFMFYILLQHVQSIKICSDDSSGQQRKVDVEMENVSGPCSCDLLVKTTDLSPSVSLNFNNTQDNDVNCSNIKIVFENNQITDKTWCGNENDFSITINKSENLNLSMIVDGTRNSFKFNIYTTSSGNLLKIKCKGSSGNNHTSINGSPTLTGTTSNTSTSVSFSSERSTASLPSTTTILSQFNTDHSTRNTKDSDDISYLPIILGCSVGGTIAIILVIVIVGCVLFRRRQTTTLSNTDNNKQAEMIITDNDVYISSNSIPNNNNQHGTKNMAEMEIIPNDLYQSSDSLADDLNDSRQHEHVPGQIEQVPNTNAEYAVVKKKPKKVLNTDTAIELTTNQNKVKTDYDNVQIEKDNLKIEIARNVGPKGDEYTLVNKY